MAAARCLSWMFSTPTMRSSEFQKRYSLVWKLAIMRSSAPESQAGTWARRARSPAPDPEIHLQPTRRARLRDAGGAERKAEPYSRNPPETDHLLSSRKAPLSVPRRRRPVKAARRGPAGKWPAWQDGHGKSWGAVLQNAFVDSCVSAGACSAAPALTELRLCNQSP